MDPVLMGKVVQRITMEALAMAPLLASSVVFRELVRREAVARVLREPHLLELEPSHLERRSRPERR